MGGVVRRPGAVVFDLDGVLVDSEPYWAAGFVAVANSALDRAGSRAPRFALADMRAYEGGRVDESLARMLAARGMPVAPVGAHRASARAQDRAPTRAGLDLGALTDAVIDHVSAAFRAHPTPIEASVRAARELAAHGIPLGVASSSAETFIDAALDAIGLDNDIQVRRSALRLARGKPAPDVYLLAAADLGVDPADCLAVEDSTTGLVAALTAGMQVVWLRRAGWDDDPREAAATALRRAGADPAAAERIVAVTRELDPRDLLASLA